MPEFIFELPGDFIPIVQPTIPAGQVDHVAEALDRLPHQFKGKTNIVKLLTALVEPVQELEQVFQDLLTLRSVDTAIGFVLDLLGKIVGQPRNGLGDDDYRRYIRARIATNRSHGLVSDLIIISRLIVNDPVAQIQIDQQGIAAVVARILKVAITDTIAGILISFLSAAVAGGVRIILESSPEPVAHWARFDVSNFDDSAALMLSARSN